MRDSHLTLSRTALTIAFTSALIAATLSLLSSVSGHNDGWALTGMLPALIPLAFLSGLVIALTSFREATVFMVVFNIFLLLIPSIKYTVPVGIGDVYENLGMVRVLLERGYVPLERAYTFFPLSHVSVVQVILVTGMPALFIFGSFMQITYGILAPCIIYSLIKQICRYPEKAKYVLILSPFLFYWNFNQSGLIAPSLAHVFVFLSLLFFLKIIEGSHRFGRADAVALLIILVAMVFTHHYSVFIFSLVLALGIFISEFVRAAIHIRYSEFVRRTSFSVLILFCMFISWWMYQAQSIFRFPLTLMRLLLAGEPLGYQQLIPPGRGLAELSFIEWVTQLVLKYSLYFEVALLSCMGLLLFCWRLIHGKHIGNPYGLFWASIMVLGYVCIFFLQWVSGYGDVHWSRILSSAFLFSPLFAWIPFVFLQKRRVAIAFLLGLMLLTPLPQFFPSEPLGTGYNLVTTEYNVAQLNFASAVIPAHRNLAGPYTTMQLFNALLVGGPNDAPIFLEGYFSRHILDHLFGKNDGEGLSYLRRFDPYVLIHLNRIAGVGTDDIGRRHDDSRIIDALNRIGLNILYSNSASFILNQLP